MQRELLEAALEKGAQEAAHHLALKTLIKAQQKVGMKRSIFSEIRWQLGAAVAAVGVMVPIQVVPTMLRLPTTLDILGLVMEVKLKMAPPRAHIPAQGKARLHMMVDILVLLGNTTHRAPGMVVAQARQAGIQGQVAVTAVRQEMGLARRVTAMGRADTLEQLPTVLRRRAARGQLEATSPVTPPTPATLKATDSMHPVVKAQELFPVAARRLQVKLVPPDQAPLLLAQAARLVVVVALQLVLDRRLMVVASETLLVAGEVSDKQVVDLSVVVEAVEEWERLVRPQVLAGVEVVWGKLLVLVLDKPVDLLARLEAVVLAEDMGRHQAVAEAGEATLLVSVLIVEGSKDQVLALLLMRALEVVRQPAGEEDQEASLLPSHPMDLSMVRLEGWGPTQHYFMLLLRVI